MSEFTGQDTAVANPHIETNSEKVYATEVQSPTEPIRKFFFHNHK